MKNKIKVSVCLITYNHKDFIKEAIEGALKQILNKSSFEIIIGDDCSTDGTGDICRHYADIYPELIKYKRNDSNLGMVSNWIETLKRCNGDYIALCEGDDYWIDPNKLQKQVDFLDKNKDYVISFHDCLIIDEKGHLIKDSKLEGQLKRDLSKEEVICGQLMPTNTVLFRNGIVRDFPKEIYSITNLDTFIFSLLGHYGKARFEEMVLPNAYRIHKGGVWSLKNAITKGRSNLHTYKSLYKVIDEKYKHLLKKKLFINSMEFVRMQDSFWGKLKVFLSSFKYFSLSKSSIKITLLMILYLVRYNNVKV